MNDFFVGARNTYYLVQRIEVNFESSHIGLIICWADNCIAIEVANQKLGPSPTCKPKLQQVGIYYLVIITKILF